MTVSQAVALCWTRRQLDNVDNACLFSHHRSIGRARARAYKERAPRPSTHTRLACKLRGRPRTVRGPSSSPTTSGDAISSTFFRPTLSAIPLRPLPSLRDEASLIHFLLSPRTPTSHIHPQRIWKLEREIAAPDRGGTISRDFANRFFFFFFFF